VFLVLIWMKRLVVFGMLIFLCSGAFAISGVSPGSYEIDFESGMSKDFVFHFVFDEGVRAEIYLEGDLAEYMSVDKSEISGKESVVASLNFPEVVDSPGVNKVRVGARQIVSDANGVGVAANVRGVIKINIPYPGRWIDLELVAPNVNVGEAVNMKLKIFNRGSDDVLVSPMIQIFKDEEFLDNFDLKRVRVAASESVDVEFDLNSSVYSVGDYMATALADYGEERLARDDNPFKIGELRVEILNYTRNFEEGGIRKFEIEVESFWNNKIDDLYAEVIVDGDDDIGFVTPITELKAWGTKTLEGFLDVSDVGTKTLDASIVLYYNNRTSSESVELSVELGYDYSNLFFVFGILIVVGLIVWRVVVFVKRVKKHRRK
jgi:hypothetical protein